MIQVHSLSKQYGAKFAIKNVSFSAHPGEILGLLGPNGSGKTTLMRILACSLWPTSGSAEVCGFDIFHSPSEIKLRVGYLPENPPLYKELSVESYLYYVAQLKNIPWRSRGSRVAKVIELCHLGDYRKARIRTLSRGYCQRVGLAQAIIHEPAVLILDEPTNGLDPIQIREFRSLLRALCANRTILLSTHILAEATLLCHRIAILDRGELKGIDTLENLVKRFKRGVRLEFLFQSADGGEGEEEIESRLKTISGVLSLQRVRGDDGFVRILCEVDSTDCRSRLLQMVAEQKWDLIEMKKVDLTLEDVFIDMTRRSL